MSFYKTNNNRLVFKKAESMIVIPYVYNGTLDDYILGTEVYDISAIIGDSVVIEQSEGNKDLKENEFTNEPLLECYSGGRYTFSAQCLDLQDTVLKALFFADTPVSTVNGLAAMRNEFELRYALIRIRFEGSDVSDIVLPKVCLNGNLFIQQLKTRAGQGNIMGTAYPKKIGAIIYGTTNLYRFEAAVSRTFVPNTPMLFVPKCDEVLIHKSGSGSAASYFGVNFRAGAVADNYTVNETQGTFSAV